MKCRWTIKEAFIGPLIVIVGLGWLPLSMIGQLLTARHGFNSNPAWGAIVGCGIVWGPPLIWATYAALVASLGFVRAHGLMPFDHVSEPVTTDLREADQ